MKLSNVSLVSTMVVLGLAAVGCSAKTDGDSDGNLGTDEAQLVADNAESQDEAETMESAVEEPLSGADPTNPGTPADGTDDAELLAKVKANPGKWFKPAGCIATTLAGNVATHVFTSCSGPYGLANFTGTVTSTYVRGNGSLTITHEATGFKANGASITGKRIVVYTRNGAVVTKHRTGDWTGTNKNGKPFTHTADFTATWDASTKCITRDGTSERTVAGREHSFTISGYKRCGIGDAGCPESGTIVLERTKASGATGRVTIEFLGGRDYTITGPKGGQVTRSLVCTP